MEATKQSPRLKFSPEEDKRIIDLFNQAAAVFGPNAVDWKEIGQLMHKTARQCRERYKNYLSPGISNGPWTVEEDALLREKVESVGCHWAKMVKHFPGRSHVNLKNRWNFLSHRNQKVSKVEKYPATKRFVMTTAVHEFIAGIGEPQVVDWFDAKLV